MAQVIWTPDALYDLRSTYERIARDSMSNTIADKWYDRFMAASRALELFPEIGSPVEDLGREDFREQIIGPFRLLYRIEGERCMIVNLIRAERDLKNFYASLDLT